MRNCLASIVLTLIGVLLIGCASESVSQVIQTQPKHTYITRQPPEAAISTLALVAEPIAGRPELIDHAAQRLIISNLHPMGHRISLLVVEAKASDAGTRILMWDRGVQPVGDDWSVRLWKAYVERMTAEGIETRDGA